MSRNADEFVASFVRLAPDRVARATELWLAIEQGEEGNLPELRRLLHTLKGEAGMLGLEACAEFAALLEDVIKHVSRAGGSSNELGSAILGGLEAFAALAMANEGEEPAPEILDIRKQLEAVRDDMDRLEKHSSKPPAADAKKPEKPAEEAEPDRPMEAAARAQTLDVDAVQALLGEIRRLHGEQALLQPMLREVQRMLRALLTEIDPRLSHESIVERIAKTLGYGWQVERRIGAIRTQWSANAFTTGLSLEQLEEQVRKAALVPVTRITAQVQRTARSAAQILGKQIDIDVSGAAHLDAAIEQRLAPALLHLVRNAVDHGIEDAETRRARNKSPRGRISVMIEQTESRVQVYVQDDGGGIDVERLRQRMAQTHANAATLGEDEVIQQIFAHGVTTRDTTNAISGRGVGLDVVAKEVRSVAGHIRVETQAGRGTRFVLTMPTTLRADLIVSVSVGSVRCAIPARAIRELRFAGPLQNTPDGPRISLDGPAGKRLAPVFSLASLLGASREIAPGDPVVILEHGASLFGLSVETYDNPRLLTFQSTHELAMQSKLVRAVAPSADGGVYLLLDVAELFSALTAQQGSGGSTRGDGEQRTRHVLVAEDAPIARELLSGILRSFGLRVSVAVDGQKALEIMRVERPDVVLTDIEMPVLDGLGLIERMRRDPALEAIPVVILSTRADPATQRRAAELGVRAFLSKQRFAEDEVRSVIESCLEIG